MATARLTAMPSLYPAGRPYITTQEYRLAPTGVDVSSLVRGDAAGTEAMLARQVARASAWVDVICGQTLTARTDTQLGRYRCDREGNLQVFPRFSPVLAVTAFSYGTTPANMTSLSDLSQIWVEDTEFQVPMGSSAMFTSAGPLQFGPSIRPGGVVRALYSYVAGFSNTTLSSAASAGATSISVANALGILPGLTQLSITDGAQSEVVSVDPSYTLGSSTVPLASPLAFSHQQIGVSVTALPESVREATILLTSTLIQTRGAVAVIAPAVGGVSARYTQSGSTRARAQRVPADDNQSIADELLTPFKRVR